MPSRVYAVPSDYSNLAEEAWSGSQDLLEKRLRSASIEVEKIVRLARYDVDDDGYPTDEDIAEAFTEATCAIVEHWQETDDPRGVEALQGAVKIGSVSLGTTSSSSDGLNARERLARRIGDKAIDILTNAALVTSAVAHT